MKHRVLKASHGLIITHISANLPYIGVGDRFTPQKSHAKAQRRKDFRPCALVLTISPMGASKYTVFGNTIGIMYRVQKEVGLDIEAHLFPATAFDHPERGSFAAYIIKNGVPILPLAEGAKP